MLSLSLKSKIVLAIIVVISLFGSVATWFVFDQTKTKIEALQEDYLKVIAIDQSTTIHQMFNNTRDLVESMSRQKAVIDLLAESPEKLADSQIIDLLNSYNPANSITTVTVMDINGSVKLSNDAELVGKNYGFRAYFQKAINGDPGYDMIFGKISKEVGYYFAFPVKTSSGEIIGVVAVKYPANFIESYIQRGTLNLYGHYILTDNNGIVLRSANGDEEMRSLGRLTGVKANIRDRFGDVEIGELGYEDLQSTIENYSGPIVIKQSKYNLDKEYIFAVSKLGSLPFYLILGEERTLFGGVAYNIAFGLSVMVLISMVLVTVLIYLLISKFLQPLVDLRHSVQSFAAGQTKIIETIKTNDEVGELSRAFVDMTVHLKDAISETDKKIKTRTSELRKVNKYMIGREIKMIELKKTLADLKARVSQEHEDKI